MSYALGNRGGYRIDDDNGDYYLGWRGGFFIEEDTGAAPSTSYPQGLHKIEMGSNPQRSQSLNGELQT